MITYRILPPAEYDKLVGHPAFGSWIPNPEWSIVVVGEEDGKIVGLWSAINVVQMEGFWVDPAYRRRSRIPIGLIKTMRRVLDRFHIPQAFCWSASPEISDYMTRLAPFGFSKLPFETFQFSVKDPHPCQQQLS